MQQVRRIRRGLQSLPLVVGQKHAVGENTGFSYDIRQITRQ